MATSNTGVIIKRSFQTAIPPALEPGELAYSYVSNVIFVGSATGDGVLNIGGRYYTETLDAATPQNVANTVVRRDANGNFQGVLVGNANTADRLSNARTFFISGGDISTSGVQFDGTSNVTLNASLNTIDGLTPGIYGGETSVPVIQVAANGRIMVVSNTASAGALKVGSLDGSNGNLISNVISGVTGLNFDTSTGFKVDDLGSGNVKISLGSSFKTWEVDGQANLVARAEDTVRFGQANGIVITTNPNDDPKSITFDGSPIFTVANGATTLAQAAFNVANNAITGSAIDQFARDRANTDVTNVSLVGSSIGSSTQIPVIGYAANGRIISAGVASPQIGTGSARGIVQLNDSVSSTSGVSGANAATPLAVKTAYDYAQVSFDHANTTSTLAQAAFNKANSASISSTDQFARDTANTAASNITILQGVNTTQNTDISILYGTNLTQNNSITVIQGVDNTQNTRLSSVENLVGSSYNQANAAFTQANVGVAFINTGGTVTGNVSFTKDVTVTGNLNVLGNTTTISVTEVIVDDPLLYLGANNYTSDAVDIGIIGNYNDGINAHTGIFRDPNLKEWIFFKGYTPEVESNNLIDLNHASFKHANVYSAYFKGNLIGSNATVNGLDLYNYVTSAYAKGNTVGILSQASFDYANTAAANTVYTQGVDATQNTNISAVNTYAASAYSKANSANVLAQAAFDVANTAAAGSIDQYARNTANTATSNTIYTQGVDATQNTNISSVNTFASSAYDKANSANVLAQAAFNIANTDVTNISLAGSSVGSSTQIPVIGYAANGRIISAGVASPQTAAGSVKGIVELSDSTSSSLDVSGANAATPLAVKTTFDYAQASFNAANTAAANTVYTQGVDATQNTNISAVNTFAASAYNQANSANVLAQAAFDTANVASVNITILQGVNTTQNTNISAVNTYATSAYNKANSANVLAQSAFDKANSAAASSVDQYARDTANTATSNITILQGVNLTQNTNISSVNTFAGSAYDKANTVGTLAQSGFDKANSTGILAQAAFDKANTDNTLGQAAFDKANSTNVLAQSAYDTANTKLNITGGTVTGNISFTGANVALGNIANVHIYGGNTGQLLTTDNFGNLSFIDLPTPNTVTYTANSLIQTNGVYVSGNLWSTQVFGDYATSNGAYVLTDGTGSAPAWYIDFDFINVVKFNRVVMNINYTQSSGHTIYVQLYNNTTSVWDSIGTYTGLGSYYAFALEVIDEFAYLNAGRVQLRLYHSNQGSALHQTSIDYVALEQSYQGPQGPRGPTGATGATGATGNGVSSGGTTGQVLIKNSSTNYDTSWSNNLIDAWNTANVTNILAQAAFDKANTSITSDQYARDTANSASANTIYTQGVDTTQNTNISYVTTFAGSAYDKANSTGILAQAAFDKANTGVATSTDQYARDTANSAAANTIYTQGVDTTQNTNISSVNTFAGSAYDKANSANVLAQAAFDKANTAASGSVDQYARDTANTATSNITIIQGVNTTQNTNISAVNTYATSAFGHANAAFTAANNRVLKTGDTITGTLNISSGIASTKPNTGSLLVTGGVGVSDSIYVGNKVGFSNTSNISMVYQYYNATTNSLDTVFG